MRLEIGSREATWNGVGMHLGFAPEIIDDQVFIHSLDLRKNLEPLLLAGPLNFGANPVLVLQRRTVLLLPAAERPGRGSQGWPALG